MHRIRNLLIDHWYENGESEEADFSYIDGHIRIYYGSRVNLPAKYVFL